MELATAAQVVVGVGVKVACHGGGRSLDEDPLFLFCVFCF
jgi:tellurite resistance protein